MMGGFGMMNMGMMGFGVIIWLINLLGIGFVVYWAVKLALKDKEKNK